MTLTPPRSLAAIDAAIKAIKAELRSLPLFRELAVLEETRAKLLGIARQSVTEEDVEEALGCEPRRERVTIVDAAERAITAAQHPLTSRQLLEETPRFGAVVGGVDKLANLTSILSKRADKLQSVRWQGNYAWWFRDRPLPLYDQLPGTVTQDTSEVHH